MTQTMEILTDQTVKVADLVVIGLGYVGLPLVQAACRSHMSVVGFDINQGVTSGLNAGRSHIDDLSDDHVAELLSCGFFATSNEAYLKNSRVITICVPTPLSNDGRPDLTAVIAATRSVARNLSSGTTVILQSTTYPGTTDEIVKPILEQESGLTAGVDFHLAFSPERIDPGNTAFRMHNTPKVVGGLTSTCTASAVNFFSQFVDTVVPAKGPREAETAKLLENSYRYVNIALVNEMAQFCRDLDIDIWDVVSLASTKPYGFQAFYPGPGVGGHCIPIDPLYLSSHVRDKLGRPFQSIELAHQINSAMPAYIVQRVQDILNTDGKALRGSTILLLGVTYKPNISDLRESPARPLAEALLAKGADIMFHDPGIKAWTMNDNSEIHCVEDLHHAVRCADLVILMQNHKEYDADTLAEQSIRFLDSRGVTTTTQAQRL